MGRGFNIHTCTQKQNKVYILYVIKYITYDYHIHSNTLSYTQTCHCRSMCMHRWNPHLLQLIRLIQIEEIHFQSGLGSNVTAAFLVKCIHRIFFLITKCLISSWIFWPTVVVYLLEEGWPFWTAQGFRRLTPLISSHNQPIPYSVSTRSRSVSYTHLTLPTRRWV